MQAGVEVLVANERIIELDEVIATGIQPIEVGARGEVAQVLGVHYHVYGMILEATNTIMALALSTNPEYVDGLPAAYTLDDFAIDRSLYGRKVWRFRRGATGDGTTGSYNRDIVSAEVPLYGLFRPRRQIFIAFTVGFSTDIKVGCELYYLPIAAPAAVINAINMKYGKFRRK